MRVAVKHREHGDNDARGPYRCSTDSAMQPPSTSTDSAIPTSTGGSGTDEHAHDCPRDHHRGKDHGQDIDQRSTQKCAPKTHRNHRQQVIDSAEGMDEAGLESTGRPVPMCAAAGSERSDPTPTAPTIHAARDPRAANQAGTQCARSRLPWPLVIHAVRVRRCKERELGRRRRVLVLVQTISDTAWSCRRSKAISRRWTYRKWATGHRSPYSASCRRLGSRVQPRRTACKRWRRC